MGKKVKFGIGWNFTGLIKFDEKSDIQNQFSKRYVDSDITQQIAFSSI